MNKVTAIQGEKQPGMKVVSIPKGASLAEGPHAGRKRFPLDIFPPKLEELALGAETALGLPRGFSGPAFILAAATATGNTYQIQIKRASVQKAVFFLALVGNPNTNKSSALSFAFGPLKAKDGEMYKAYKTTLGEYEAVRGMSKKEMQEAGISEKPSPPIFTQSLASDTTPEALARILQDSPRGIAVHRDELAGWLKDFNRYHPGSEMEQWLSLWSLEPLVINRVSSGPLRIPCPFVCVAGTIQPSVIEELAQDGRAGNGFTDRLLFTWPDGLKKPEWTEDELNFSLLEAYQGAINRLLELPFTAENEANTLTLEPQAKARLFQFFNEENKPHCDEAESEILQGLHGKFDFHTARLIIPLHLLAWAYEGMEPTPPLEVSLGTVNKAIKAAEFFRAQSLKVYDRLHNSNPVEKLTADRRKIYEALPEKQFKTGDGEKVAEKLGMSGRTFRAWLAKDEKKLFDSPRHGFWQKVY